jgi:hypothetical protein
LAGLRGEPKGVTRSQDYADLNVGYEGLAVEIAKFFKGGPAPVSPEETLEIFALLQAAETSKAHNGAVVELQNAEIVSASGR